MADELTPAPAPSPDDDFAAAFAALQAPVGSVPKAATESVDPPPAPPGPNPDPVPAPTPDPDPADPADPPAVPPAPEPIPDSVAARMAQLEAELAALKEVKAAPADPPAPAPAPVEAPLYTAEEQAAIDKYRTEWPDIAAGEALARRAEYRQIVSYVFDQVRQQLEPIQQFAQRQQGRTQYDDIVDLVPDYDDVRDATLAWVEQQPEYLKAAFKQVAASGTPTDVADLISRFKRETGYGATAPAAAPVAAAAPTPAPAPAIPAAAATAAKNLRVVKSGRSEPVPGSDPNDFDGAFVAFAQASSK